ncbi:MAG: hypothetical protein P1P86_12620 [Bacteroidales bacterium]|nr:hypothetical protein [Bacteroidales bacterium]
MEKILIYIKHHLGFLWNLIEWGNNVFFTLIFKGRMDQKVAEVIGEALLSPYFFRRLNLPDARSLYELVKKQTHADLEYFNPHAFDMDAIGKQFRKKSFVMMGVFDEDFLIGYFFLRFFINKKCFVGRLIDKEYRGKGIGVAMNQIMYETAWRMGFRCMSTISRDNALVIQAHSKNQHIIILKHLQNNFLLVEFVKN